MLGNWGFRHTHTHTHTHILCLSMCLSVCLTRGNTLLPFQYDNSHANAPYCYVTRTPEPTGQWRKINEPKSFDLETEFCRWRNVGEAAVKLSCLGGWGAEGEEEDWWSDQPCVCCCLEQTGNGCNCIVLGGRCYLLIVEGPPLWSSGQSFWLQIQRSRVRSPALPDFL